MEQNSFASQHSEFQEEEEEIPNRFNNNSCSLFIHELSVESETDTIIVSEVVPIVELVKEDEDNFEDDFEEDSSFDFGKEQNWFPSNELSENQLRKKVTEESGIDVEFSKITIVEVVENSTVLHIPTSSTYQVWLKED